MLFNCPGTRLREDRIWAEPPKAARRHDRDKTVGDGNGSRLGRII
jgi:hypothetical protein